MQILFSLWGHEEKTDNFMNKFTCQIGVAIASCLLILSFPLYIVFSIYPQFTEIITFEKEVDAKQIATHITKMLVLDSTTKTLTQESITDSFIEVLKEAQLDFDLTKIKVYSSRGEVLFSTDAQDIGALNTNPYFTDIVTQGKIFSTVVRRNEKTMEDKIVKKDVVETYVPLMRDQHYIGALEIYYDITYSKHITGQFVAKSRIIILMLTLLLLLCIVLISLSVIMYQKKLIKAEKKMQMLKDRMPPFYSFHLDETDE